MSPRNRKYGIAAASLAIAFVFLLGYSSWRRSRLESAVAGSTAPSPGASSGPSGPNGKPRSPQVYDLTPDPHLKSGFLLRPMDREIFEAIAGGRLRRTDLLDLFPGRPYHVKLIGSVVEHWINYVMIDIERDGKWDEKWELREDGVSRRLYVDGDMENMVPFKLRHGRWVPF